MNILTAMRVALTEGETARIMAKGTKNLDAYLKAMQAYQLRFVMNKESLALSRKLAEEATALDPGYALPYSVQAAVLVDEVYWGVYKNPKEILERATKLAEKSNALDGSLAFTHSTLGWILTMKRDHERAVAEEELAVSLEPGSSHAYMCLGGALNFSGQYEQAIPVLKKAMRLSPIPPSVCLGQLGISYRMIGRYEESITVLKQLTQREPDALNGHLQLAATYMLSGNEKEARKEAAEVLRINPSFSLNRFAETTPMKKQADLLERWIEPLRRAGLT
jgi:tetratricopeptide (TPR) repeat protein